MSETLYVDQFGNCWFVKTVQEIQEQVGGDIKKMYSEKADGSAVHVGYVIGPHRCRAYKPLEIPVYDSSRLGDDYSYS